jgi:hypothetical protein
VVLVTTVGVASWMVVGQEVFIGETSTKFAHFRVTAIPSSTSVQLDWLDYNGDAVGTTVLASGSGVSPSGTQPALSASLPTSLTDNTTGVASNTLAAGVGIQTITLPVTAQGLGTSAIDIVTNYTLGYAFKLLSFDFMTVIPGTGGGATQTFNLEIGTTNVTGGLLTVTLAGTTTVGALTTGTAITALNTGTASDTISIEMAAGGNDFSGGSGYFILKVQNLDTANSIASLAADVNGIILALT